MRPHARTIWLPTALLLLATSAGAQTARVDVDLREAPRRLIHARLTLPAQPGPLTLVYPKWIPGEHGPTGPIRDLVNLRFTAGGRTVTWRRDEEDMFAFHLDVPAGARELAVDLDLLPSVGDGNFSAGGSVTPNLALLSWNQVVLYPEGVPSDDYSYQASLRLPEGWKWATALPVSRSSGASVEFARASLTTLVDSPVLTGRYLRTYPLGVVDGATHDLVLASDDAGAVDLPDSMIAPYRRLVREANALFGVHHYRSYHFLVTLSDNVDHFGLEHHESSDDRVPERTFVDSGPRIADADLLSHEMVHSWNGKYRRPAGLATGDYQRPMRGQLLWVYEGLTNYLGWLLAGRCGLFTPEQARGEIARAAGTLSVRPGRGWRPLFDTAVAAQVLYGAPTAWANLRRGTDFYDEGTLMWLEADTRIRSLTHGARSLDDFCHAFFDGQSGSPRVSPYTREDVEHALNAVAPSDWKAFFAARVDSLTARPPLGGIEAAGWRLAYADTATEYFESVEELYEDIDLRFSLGMRVSSKEGTLSDVMLGSPASKAGLGPDMELVAVNGREWNADRLKDAVAKSKSGGPVTLLVKNDEFFREVKLDYKDGARYPRLERRAGTPDLLDRILKPRAR